jgi:hypothetical protein
MDTPAGDYAITKIELSELHDQAKDSKGSSQFYIYLYSYVDYIFHDQTLLKAVKYFELQEFLNADGRHDKKLQHLREYVLTAKKQGGLSEVQKLAFNENRLQLIENSRLNETQASYWWYKLFNCFYNVYRHDFLGRSIHRVSTIDPQSLTASSKQQKDKLSEIQSIYEISQTNSGDRVKLERINQSLMNFEPEEGQEVYVTCMNMLHAKLIKWLARQEAETTSEVAQVSAPIKPLKNSEEPARKPASIKLNLTIKGKTMWLLINGEARTEVKKFDSKNTNNFRACTRLLNKRGYPLGVEGMAIAPKSRITDLPKTMGLVGVLADLFVDVDTRNKKITILKDVQLQADDLPALVDFCKAQFSNK